MSSAQPVQHNGISTPHMANKITSTSTHNTNSSTSASKSISSINNINNITKNNNNSTTNNNNNYQESPKARGMHQDPQTPPSPRHHQQSTHQQPDMPQTGLHASGATPKKQLHWSKQPKSNNATLGFQWDEYLKRIPAEGAPSEAFMQAAPGSIENKFKIGMRLEARDPKKNDSTSWSLASVVAIEGAQRIRLRFDGSDSMNDIFELINSNNIKPLYIDDVLYPPMAYRGNIAKYSTFVKKILAKPEVCVAPNDCFCPLPPRPPKNLFKVGHKLEALDRKNPNLIYPATVEMVQGDDIKITFDGWRGSFDYTCKYYCRDIFPLNWCKETNHPILPPKGWEALIGGITNTLTPDKPLSAATPARVSIASNSFTSNSPSPVKKSRENLATNNHNSANLVGPSNSHKISTPVQGSTAIKLKVKYTPKRQTMKANDTKTDEQQRRRPSVEVDDEEDEWQAESPPPPGVDRFQCQRTIPYNEWVKFKPPQGDNHLNKTERYMTSNGRHVESKLTNNQSTLEMHVNSTPSQAYKSTFNGSPNQFHEPQNKRVKMDKDSSATDSISLSGESSTRSLDDNITSSSVENWSVSQVLDYMTQYDPDLSKYSEKFQQEEINGKSFLLLTTDVMVKYMGLKIGPVLKINELIERAKQL